MNKTATADGHMTDGSDSSSALVWNHHALRLPVAASLLIHASVFAGALLWWQSDGAPAPRGLPEGLSVTFVRLSQPAPPAPPQAKAVSTPKVKPAAKPDPVVVQKPVPPTRKKVIQQVPALPEPKPEPRQARAEAKPQPASESTLLKTASLTSADSTDKGEGAPRGFRKTQGRQTDNVSVTLARFRTAPRPPVYPRRARELEQEGVATVRVKLDPSGNAQEVLVWQSSGYDLLDKAAIMAARKWRYMPERRGGKPVNAWVEIPVRFALK